MNSLNKNCMELCFQFLSLKELFTVIQVCTKWKEYIEKSPLIWKTQEIRITTLLDFSTPPSSLLLKYSSLIRNITFIFDYSPYGRITEERIAHLTNLLSHLPLITSLKLIIRNWANKPVLSELISSIPMNKLTKYHLFVEASSLVWNELIDLNYLVCSRCDPTQLQSLIIENKFNYLVHEMSEINSFTSLLPYSNCLKKLHLKNVVVKETELVNLTKLSCLEELLIEGNLLKTFQTAASYHQSYYQTFNTFSDFQVELLKATTPFSSSSCSSSIYFPAYQLTCLTSLILIGTAVLLAPFFCSPKEKQEKENIKIQLTSLTLKDTDGLLNESKLSFLEDPSFTSLEYISLYKLGIKIPISSDRFLCLSNLKKMELQNCHLTKFSSSFLLATQNKNLLVLKNQKKIHPPYSINLSLKKGTKK